jgi:hypothetical protein
VGSIAAPAERLRQPLEPHIHMRSGCHHGLHPSLPLISSRIYDLRGVHHVYLALNLYPRSTSSLALIPYHCLRDSLCRAYTSKTAITSSAQPCVVSLLPRLFAYFTVKSLYLSRSCLQSGNSLRPNRSTVNSLQDRDKIPSSWLPIKSDPWQMQRK